MMPNNEDPRCGDFGQFRIEDSRNDLLNTVATLVDNGYSVTVKRLELEGAYLIMYRFGEL